MNQAPPPDQSLKPALDALARKGKFDRDRLVQAHSALKIDPSNPDASEV